MTAQLIDGKNYAAGLRARLADVVKKLPAPPGLAVVIVGDDPASTVYVRNKGKAAEEVGFISRTLRLPETTTHDDLLEEVKKLNADDAIDGILVQLPLPKHIDSQQVLNAIDPAKDVDGFHPMNIGRLWAGLPSLVPCTPLGSLILIKSVLPTLSGLHAVVVGRSNIVGKPMAQLLLQNDCTVTIAHSRTANLPHVARVADVLVAAVGKPQLITADGVKPGAVVIDVGINRGTDGKLVGDVDFNAVKPVAGFITPVPGGVGPMTIACLLRNTLQAYGARRAITLTLPD
ncbi:MAG: bifunctional methylenetetrahydrofolate dehydrogenase/methenyltetrahydrofolate cyclohydrolase FolD [Alphaproteobacteria bacterium]|nr:bifunctional methylenetetrahydrofolate dehydrogenase/methenyltetrahydrofolate cyclohydrolase FolD [Alphaproteobacteria bacterium]